MRRLSSFRPNVQSGNSAVEDHGKAWEGLVLILSFFFQMLLVSVGIVKQV
jgi:hypothetical protein